VPTQNDPKPFRRSRAPSWIDSSLLDQLDGGLWHATSKSRWIAILQDGAIRPDADADFSNGFCRSIGAVSLFDLSQSDDAAPDRATPWYDWLNLRDQESRFLIEIDRVGTVARFVDPFVLIKRWKTTVAALKNEDDSFRIMPGIEAAHFCPIELCNVRRVLKIETEGWVQM
jgi:hypothetical protein